MRVRCELALEEKKMQFVLHEEKKYIKKIFLNLFWVKKGLARMPHILNLRDS